MWREGCPTGPVPGAPKMRCKKEHDTRDPHRRRIGPAHRRVTQHAFWKSCMRSPAKRLPVLPERGCSQTAKCGFTAPIPAPTFQTSSRAAGTLQQQHGPGAGALQGLGPDWQSPLRLARAIRRGKNAYNTGNHLLAAGHARHAHGSANQQLPGRRYSYHHGYYHTYQKSDVLTRGGGGCPLTLSSSLPLSLFSNSDQRQERRVVVNPEGPLLACKTAVSQTCLLLPT